MEKQKNINPENLKRFSKRTVSYWTKLMFGGPIAIGTLCKACELTQKINTNTSLQYEIPANLGYINQYFRELGIAISENSINIGNVAEHIKPTLGIICIALPIALTSSVIAAHIRNKK